MSDDFAYAASTPPDGYLSIVADSFRYAPELGQPFSYSSPYAASQYAAGSPRQPQPQISGYTRPGNPDDMPPPNPANFPYFPPGSIRNYIAGGTLSRAIQINARLDPPLPASSTTLYYSPYSGSSSSGLGTIVWGGVNGWARLLFDQVSLDLTTLTANSAYDIFVYYSLGSLSLVPIIWTTPTARATNLIFITGRKASYHPASGLPMLYLGSIYLDGNKNLNDNPSNRLLYDEYRTPSPRRRIDVLQDFTASWVPLITTWEAMRKENANPGDMGVWTHNIMLGAPIPMTYQATVRADAGGKIALSLDTTTMVSVDASFSTTGVSIAPRQLITATASAALLGFHTVRTMQSYVSEMPTTLYGCFDSEVQGALLQYGTTVDQIMTIARALTSMTISR